MTRRHRHSQNPLVGSGGVELCHTGRIHSGCALALVVLQLHDQTGRFVTDLLAELDSEHALSRQERSRAVDVVAGTLRRRRTIDILLQSQVRRPRADVEPDLWRILQTGVQQLCFGRTPDYAAVNATVELTRAVDRPEWSGFANGVLRTAARLLTDQFSTEPARNRVPVDGGNYRSLNTDIFSCPLTAPMDYFGEAFSLPRAIARRWHHQMSLTDLWTAGFHSLNVPATGMRVNRLRATVSDVVGALEAAGFVTEPGMMDESLRLTSAGRVKMLPGYTCGHWTIQDESAMLATHLLNPAPGELILDLCAAPGGKTTHLAEISGDRASIHGTDVSEQRLQLVRENVCRLGLSSVELRVIERDGSGLPELNFDAALVDVPCSNTGVLSRRPEARWRFRESDLQELTQLQTRLLMTAYDRLRPGGRLVYSTCSIEPEETNELIRNIAQAVPSMKLQKEEVTLPGQPADGAYAALLIREDNSLPADQPGPAF